MYLDQLGKVTIGVGNLIDSEQAAIDLRRYGAPLLDTNDAEVADDEIRAEWQRIKNKTGGFTLHISDAGIVSLVAKRVAECEADLIATYSEFTDFGDWPADAQLGLLSMAWAMGSRFATGWPGFRGAVAAKNWRAAAANCNMVNSWLIRRNAVNRGLFRNAAWWLEQPTFDASTLVIDIPGSRPTVRLNDKDSGSDDNIASLQRFLTWFGFPAAATGTFDAATDTAVRQFQQAENALHNGSGFGADGVVGQLSWAALGYLVPRL
jgi:peptidoglycan hydrolase-like protein with peptidoglycan-binding domain